MEVKDWETSSDGTVDSDVYLQDMNDEELNYTSDSIPKLQIRKEISKARWNEEMGMAEIVEKKGRLWTTTGIIRNSNLYCSIEEILYLAEIGALHLLDGDDTALPLKCIYEKVASKKSECCWESFEAYRHLKSLGYIVGRHGVAWTIKSGKNCCNSSSLQSQLENEEISESESQENNSICELLNGLEISEIKPVFDVYLPNSKFRKSSPGDPFFILCLTRGNPPSKLEIENLERKFNGIPLKFCHVENGRVSFFSFNRLELPVLP